MSIRNKVLIPLLSFIAAIALYSTTSYEFGLGFCIGSLLFAFWPDETS
jgi:hypothetical protein